jgi:flagellin
MRINSNAGMLNTLRTLHESKNDLKASAEKLSSGLKINRASDDPAGLIISEKMRSQISAIEQEIQNLDNRDNKLTTADGSLNTMQNNLMEMRNVALAAANEGGNSEDSQKAYQTSMDNSVNAYNQTQENASYGSQKLFDGSSGSVADPKQLENLDVSTPEKAQEAVTVIDQRMKEISDIRGQIGAEQKNEINSSRNNFQTELVNLTASESTVRDTDMAKEYADFVKSEIQTKAGMAMMAHQKQVPALVLGMLQQ